IGFYAGFEYLGQKDPKLSVVGAWQVRSDVLDLLRTSPLVKKETETGFNLRANDISYKYMFLQKVRPNTAETNYCGSGRIDIVLSTILSYRLAAGQAT